MAQQHSRVGTYSGFTEPVANGYVRTSEYVTVRDGCRLAIDVLHPAKDNVRLGGARPTVVRATGYRRSFRRGEKIYYDISRIPLIEKHPVGAIITPYEFAPVATRLVDHGYNFVSIDLRGTGASFGSYDTPVTIESGHDVADVIEWIATQPWSDRKIGMWGRSWEAAVQLAAAVVGPKHLTCICPMAMGGTFDASWFNGLFAAGFHWGYHGLRRGQDEDEQAMPVDGPDGLRLFQEATADRPKVPVTESLEAMGEFGKTGLFTEIWVNKSKQIGEPVDPKTGFPLQIQENFERFNASGIAVYWFEGWWDLNFINTALSQFNDLKLPKKLLVGPWTHSQFAFDAEPLRWFDYWLKGVDNGVMEEPVMIYSTTTVDGNAVWKAGTPGLLAREKTSYYLSVPKGVSAFRDGVLSPTVPAKSTLAYTARYDTSTGPQTRTTYLYASTQMRYPAMESRLGQVITLTTAPFDTATDLTGIPTLELSLATSTNDGAVFAALELVTPNGRSHYLTEGNINLAYRRAVEPRYGYLGEALHPVFPSQQETVVPNEEMRLIIDFMATSIHVDVGDSLRLTLAAADYGNYHVEKHDPPAEWKIALGGDNAAVLRLPLLHDQGEALDGLFEDDTAPYAFELATR